MIGDGPDRNGPLRIASRPGGLVPKKPASVYVAVPRREIFKAWALYGKQELTYDEPSVKMSPANATVAVYPKFLCSF
jgi:hypothetical protein